MLHENLNAMDTIIEQQINMIADLPIGEDRDKAIDSLCKMVSKTNEAWRIYSDEINNDARLQNDRNKTEIEAELRGNQNKNEKLRTVLDISKHILSLAAFVGFEVMAFMNERDNIVPRHNAHVRNNQIKLKI